MAFNALRTSAQTTKSRGSSLLRCATSLQMNRGVMTQSLAIGLPHYENEQQKQRMRAIHLGAIDFWKEEARRMDDLRIMDDVTKESNQRVNINVIADQQVQNLSEEMIAEGILEPNIGRFAERRL